MNLVRPTGTNGLYPEEADLSHAAHATVYVTGTQVERSEGAGKKITLREKNLLTYIFPILKDSIRQLRESCSTELHRKINVLNVFPTHVANIFLCV